MTNAISEHGFGAIKDSGSTFTIVADKGSALIRPSNTNQLTGWIYFTLPSPAPGYTGLKNVTIDFSSQSAYVDAVNIWLANRKVFSAENLQKTSSWTEDIAAGQAVYQGKGIAVAVYVEFDSLASALRFQSVSIGI
ncbi:hypothetical protein QBC44DRAFT_336571 [Cladorrhinum sp. PSN332]|nr:hypothetical protein QBC44DRAFT_336571 [Cladorrhinum sp. PSN332]